MAPPPIDPERLADATARRLLARAAELETDGPTLAQLRQAATEAGISPAAFDAAVAEWRADQPVEAPANSTRPWVDRLQRNALAFAIGWVALAGLAAAERLVTAPWLVHKLSDPVALAIGGAIAARLRARTATVVLGGLAISQGAEFLMDMFSGVPTIHGFGAHMALMVAGVAGIAVGLRMWRRSGDIQRDPQAPSGARPTTSQADGPSASRAVGPTNADADKRFMEKLRLRRDSCLVRVQGT